MPRALLRASQHLLLVALFFAFGGNWLVLQGVAWGKMLIDYSRTATLAEAVEKTFDGDHPCSMCQSIKKGRDTEKKEEGVMLVKKMEVFCEGEKAALMARPFVVTTLLEESRAWQPRALVPVSPPPQSV